MNKILFLSLLKSGLLLFLWRKLGFTSMYAANFIVIFLSLRFLPRKDENQQRPLLIIMETLVPIFSSLAFGFYLLTTSFLKIFDKKEDDFDHHLPFGEEHYRQFLEAKKDELIIDHIDSDEESKLHDSFQIEPFLDIIEGSDIDLKINAIGKLSAVPAKSSIALLKLAMNDPSYEVKYFASNSLSLLERQLIGNIEVLGQSIQRFPENAQNFTQRGLAYLNMYYLGIIDSGVADIFLERALNDFLFSLQLDPSQSYLFVKILEIHTYRGEHDQILELDTLLSEMKFADEEKVKIRFYLAEAFYRRGEWKKLRDCLAELKDSTYRAPLMIEPIEFWTEAAQ